jgi:MFS family permease
LNTDKRNYLLLFLDPVLYVSGMAFISINAVIPNFLNELGASAFQISLASGLAAIGTLVSQPIFAQIAMGLPVKSQIFARLLAIQRFLLLAYVLTMPFISKHNPMLSVLLFLIFWGIFNFFVGCNSPFYMGILSKVIPDNQWGRLVGFADAAGNLVALGSAFLIGILLKNLTFPYNYTWIFGIGITLLLANACCFALIQEKPEKVQKQPINYFKYIAEIPYALKAQKEFAVSVLGNSFLVVSNIALAFYSLAAIRVYDAGSEQVALFTGIGIMVNIFGGVIFGIIGDRVGNRYVLAIAAFLSMLAAIMVLTVPSLIAIHIGFALSSLSLGGYNIGNGINIIDHCPKDQVPLYISINIMITLTASSLVTLMAGAVIDTFSFTPLFFFTGACGMAAFITFFRFNRRNKSTFKTDSKP